MKLIIEAEPKEIAALILTLQGQRDESQNQDKEAIADAFRGALLDQSGTAVIKESKKATPEGQIQGLAEEGLQLLRDLAEDKFTAILQGVIGPDGIRDQNGNDF